MLPIRCSGPPATTETEGGCTTLSNTTPDISYLSNFFTTGSASTLAWEPSHIYSCLDAPHLHTDSDRPIGRFTALVPDLSIKGPIKSIGPAGLKSTTSAISSRPSQTKLNQLSGPYYPFKNEIFRKNFFKNTLERIRVIPKESLPKILV